MIYSMMKPQDTWSWTCSPGNTAGAAIDPSLFSRNICFEKLIRLNNQCMENNVIRSQIKRKAEVGKWSEILYAAGI